MFNGYWLGFIEWLDKLATFMNNDVTFLENSWIVIEFKDLNRDGTWTSFTETGSISRCIWYHKRPEMRAIYKELDDSYHSQIKVRGIHFWSSAPQECW